jgi:tetratricopeptide (TPR) repeat protein
MFDTGPPSLQLLDVSTGTFTPFSAPEPLWQALAMTAQRYPEAIVRGPDGRPLDPPTVLIEGSLLRFVGGALEDVALLRNEHVGGAAVGLPSGEILVVGDPDEGIVELCPTGQAPPATRSLGGPAAGTGSVGAAAPGRPALAADDVGFVDPRGGRGWGDRCFVHLKAKRYAPARAACEEGLEIATDDTVRGSIYYNLGRIAEETGDGAEARRFYQRSLEVRPDSAQVRQRLDALAE